MKTFRQFLRGKIREDSPVGDLAQDAFDKSVKWNGTSIESLMKNLEKHGACSEAKKALFEAACEYLAEMGFNDDYLSDDDGEDENEEESYRFSGIWDLIN